MTEMMPVIATITLLQIILLTVAVWQGIHILVTNRRMKRIRGVLVEQKRLLTSMYLAGMISDDDWVRANTPPSRRSLTLTIEPVRGFPSPPPRTPTGFRFVDPGARAWEN